MKFSTLSAIGAAILATPLSTATPTPANAAVDSSSSTSPSSNCHAKEANFDSRPATSAPEDFYMQDLRYKNFEIVKADPKKTYFKAQGGSKMLALKKGDKGIIKVAPNNQAQDSSYFFPGNFYGGCAKKDKSGVAKPVKCSVSFATPEVEYGGSLITISTVYEQYAGSHKLEAGNWGGPSTPYINVTMYDAPKGSVLYLGGLQYSVDCIFCEKDEICSS